MATSERMADGAPNESGRKVGHTPGPWHVDDGGDGEILIWDGTDGPYIAEVYESPNEQANAHLIAAAPELLEALEAFQNAVHADNSEGLPAQYREADALAMAAIAKATGAQS